MHKRKSESEGSKTPIPSGGSVMSKRVKIATKKVTAKVAAKKKKTVTKKNKKVIKGCLSYPRSLSTNT